MRSWQIPWFMLLVYDARRLRRLLTGFKCAHILPWLTCRVSSLCSFQSSSEQRSGSTSTSRMPTGERNTSHCFYPSSGSLTVLQSTESLLIVEARSEYGIETPMNEHLYSSNSFYLPSRLLLHSGLQGSDWNLALWWRETQMKQFGIV